MTGLPEVVVFEVVVERFDNNSYPYYKVLSRRTIFEDAVEILIDTPEFAANKNCCVRQVSLQILPNGNVGWVTNLVAYQNERGNDIYHPDYDPRNKDPEWGNYLRLKKKFDKMVNSAKDEVDNDGRS